MLKEYALIPDVFDETCYSTAGICPIQLNNIRDLVLHEGIVSNLRNGEWRRYLTRQNNRFHRAGQELIKAIGKESRLVKRPPCLTTAPEVDRDWASEAVASHDQQALDGVLVSHRHAAEFGAKPIVGCIESLHKCDWWNARSPSVRLARSIEEYLRVLSLVLHNANSLMFIDPHLDVARHNYQEFQRLIAACARDNPNLNPLIEIHRVCYIGSGQQRRIIANEEWQESFTRILRPLVQQYALRIEVFIWDDFHDRYLISNLIGISLPNGFDTTTNPTDVTTWTRLGPKEKDDVQREFDPAAARHQLIYRFAVR
jgi:hypothetical protein